MFTSSPIDEIIILRWKHINTLQRQSIKSYLNNTEDLTKCTEYYGSVCKGGQSW
jgi:hypothetical protein